jgi:hypothetical protein
LRDTGKQDAQDHGDPRSRRRLGGRADHGPHLVITLRIAGQKLTGRVRTKTFRRAQETIRLHGVDGVFCQLQGKLAGTKIEEGSIIGQPKPASTKPEPAL